MFQARIRPSDRRATAFRWLERKLKAGCPAIQTWITGDGSLTSPMPTASNGQVVCRLTMQAEPMQPEIILGDHGGRSYRAPVTIAMELVAPGLAADDWLAIQRQIEEATPMPRNFRTTDPTWRDAREHCVNDIEWVQPLIPTDESSYGGSVRLTVYITH